MTDAGPKSPCIAVCVLDEHDICMGCYRSSAEITDWVMASAQEKRDMLRRAQERMQASFPVRPD